MGRWPTLKLWKGAAAGVPARLGNERRLESLRRGNNF